MTNLPYPPDGGLKKQVRSFSDTFSIFKLIADEIARRQQSQR